MRAAFMVFVQDSRVLETTSLWAEGQEEEVCERCQFRSFSKDNWISEQWVKYLF